MAVAELASIDGKISPTAGASVPVADDGLLRGDGVFEMIRLYAGRPFALREHLDRLERSAAAIELPVDRGAVEREVAALLDAFGDDDAALRIVVTRGGRRIAMTEPLPEWAESARVATVTYTPTEILTGVKSTSYAANMQATRIAASKGADEAILVRPDGVVLEAPTSAVFWVSGGELRTPALEVGILNSITRDRILAALDVAEGEWDVDDLRGAEEAFLASTTREVHPISAVDGTELPGAPERTRQAADALRATIERELG
ncbi:MAG TPA: aminotransferase class IV [Solirubrobacterales bacterium]|nr:aminotransferase class IV [Solirubrobacterales bacterium]